MPKLSDFATSSSTLNFPVGGGAINSGDLIQIGGLGSRAFPVKTADYAKFGAPTQILPPTSLTSSAQTIQQNQQAAVTDSFGNIYVGVQNYVYKYSPQGTLIWSINALAFATVACAQILQLSDGSMAYLGADYTAGTLNVLTFDPNTGHLISNVPSMGVTYFASSAAYFTACALSAGGFAIAYQSNATQTDFLLQTYSNKCAAVLAATQINTVTASASCLCSISQLSNGNLVCATSSSGALTFVVVTTSGVSVVSSTSVLSSNATVLDLSVLPGYFAVCAVGNPQCVCSVYNNSGVMQGSQLVAGNNSTGGAPLRLINDGSNFWFGVNNIYVYQITTSGVATSIFSSSVDLTGTGNTTMDMAIAENILVIFAGHTGTGDQVYYYVPLPDPALPILATTYLTVAVLGSNATTAGCFWPKVIFKGDFTAIFLYDHQNAASTFMSIVKLDASAIVGVSQTTNPALNTGSLGSPNMIRVSAGPGAYTTNPTGGTPGVSFDHRGQSTISGNSGVIYTNSTVLVGVGQTPRNIN